MKLKVLMENTFDVPDLLESELRGAIDAKDDEYRDELIGDLESHGYVLESKILSVEEVES